MTQKAKKLFIEKEKLREKVMGYSVAETEDVKWVPILSIVEQKGTESAELVDQGSSWSIKEQAAATEPNLTGRDMNIK